MSDQRKRLVSPDVGTRIDQALNVVVDMARAKRMTTVMEFNGIDLVAHPGDTTDVVGNRYARVREEYQHSNRVRRQESQLAQAEGILNIAMMRLGGEHPVLVYDSEGYHVWLRSVVAEIAEALDG